MATYTPDDETAALFTRYKRAKETEAQLLPLVKAKAVEDMRHKGASIVDLQRRTGITNEVFRRLARDNEIERKREPTVGRDAKPKPAAG